MRWRAEPTRSGVVARRVAAAVVLSALAACGNGSGSTSPTAPSAPLEGPPAVSVHPVLAVEPCRDDDARTVPDRTRARCYRLGPAFVLRGDLVEPRVEVVDEAFSVVVSFAAPSRARIRTGFDACRAGAADCPALDGDHGAAAVVIDRVVEAAPTISTTDVVDTGLVLRGDLGEDEAYRIADALSR